jgi:RNA-directed DNA polymerase
MKPNFPITIQSISSDENIELAYQQLCRGWANKGDNHDCWHLRFHWQKIKPQIQKLLRSGDYYLSPCKAVKVEEHSIGIWCAEDALVLKVLTNVLTEAIKPHLSSCCKHLKGNSGTKKAVMLAKRLSSEYTFVLKSDVKSFYASMNHSLIMSQFERYVSDDAVLKLLRQFLNHLDDVNGDLFECTRGIGKGSSLSPLIGALYLDELDKVLAGYAQHVGAVYIRYMDDWLFLCNTRWQLRNAVRKMNQVLVRLKVTKAEKKTFIGKLDKGFDWLGYRIFAMGGGKPDASAFNENEDEDDKTSGTGGKPLKMETSVALCALSASDLLVDRGEKRIFALGVSAGCFGNFLRKLFRLYERGASDEALEGDVRRWWCWVNGGVVLDGLSVGALSVDGLDQLH